MNRQTIKMIASNPETRKFEEVFPESEVEVNEMYPRFWVNSIGEWVSIPDVTAEDVYADWLKQMSNR